MRFLDQADDFQFLGPGSRVSPIRDHAFFDVWTGFGPPMDLSCPLPLHRPIAQRRFAFMAPPQVASN
jgi:hypothetical protein